MGIQVPVGEGQVTLLWQVVGQPRIVTTSFGVGQTLGGPADPVDLANDAYEAATSVTGGFGPCAPSNMAPQWTFLGAQGMVMTNPGPVTADKLLPVTGSSAIQPMPLNCSVLLTKTTALGGRRNRGRNYIPPIWPDEVNVDARGSITPVSAGQISTSWNLFRTRMATADHALLLHHSDGTPGTLITSLSVSLIIGTQRRRLR